MAVRTSAQLAWRGRVETAIRLAAPALDLLLYAGERVSRVAGRNELDPEPPRRALGPPGGRTSIGAHPVIPPAAEG